jgi:preprotein translocase SecE subunit
MANPFTEYLRQTRGELRHVAWPTRTQTIVYALLVAAISIGIALYLGLFDFLFTAGLSRLLNVLPQAAPTENPVTVTQVATGTMPAPSAPASH